MRSRPVASAGALALLVIAGCDSDPSDEPTDGVTAPESATATTEEPTTEPEPTSEPSDTGEDTETPDDSDDASPDGEGEAPLGEFTTEETRSEGYPEAILGSPGELLEPAAVRLGTHDGFDRLVIEFTGDGQPAWLASYTDLVLRPGAAEGDDPEAEILVDGEAILQVSIAGTSPMTPTQELGDVVEGAGEIVTDVVFTGYFEGFFSVNLGLPSEAGYSVTTLTDPSRLVIDVAHD